MSSEIAWIVSGAALAALVAGFGACALWLVMPLRKRLDAAAGRLEALELKAAKAADVAARAARAERAGAARLEHLGERLGRLEVRAQSRDLEQAIRAAAGGEALEPVAHFGLNEGEASLVRLLHGKLDAGASARATR